MNFQLAGRNTRADWRAQTPCFAPLPVRSQRTTVSSSATRAHLTATASLPWILISKSASLSIRTIAFLIPPEVLYAVNFVLQSERAKKYQALPGANFSIILGVDSLPVRSAAS